MGAALAGNVALLMWAAGLGGLAGGAMFWSRVAWRGVSASAGFRPSRVFAREPLNLRVRIANGKRLPLPLVRVTVWLPPGLFPQPGTGAPTVRGFQRSVYLGGRSEAILDLPVRARNRGEYWLERVQLVLSDPFDLAPVRRDLVPEASLLVMPQPGIGIPMHVRRRLPFGVPARAARMFEERERFAGVRPYESGDPLNRIHWKLTGHAGQLHTKLFEPTRTADVVLVLDLATGEPFWDSIFPEIAEDTIGWAAFLARQAVEAGWRVGLVANVHLSRGRGPLRVPPSSARGHAAALFAALARMSNEATSDLAPILRETGRTIGGNATAVVISPRPGPWLRHELVVLRRRGAEVLHLSPLEARSPRVGEP
ncbi:MAG: DUF58 domain-containing protein [Actinomycetota bacterium]